MILVNTHWLSWKIPLRSMESWFPGKVALFLLVNLPLSGWNVSVLQKSKVSRTVLASEVRLYSLRQLSLIYGLVAKNKRLHKLSRITVKYWLAAVIMNAYALSHHPSLFVCAFDMLTSWVLASSMHTVHFAGLRLHIQVKQYSVLNIPIRSAAVVCVNFMWNHV